MAWIIMVDHITDSDGKSRVGCRSPGWSEAKAAELGQARYAPHGFRLYDDDGNLYYEGRSTVVDSFAPLDDLGTPDAGCTEIRYWRPGGTWESL